MKKVRIKRLTLSNFKGIKSFETVFNGTTKIFGDNATGKTTLVDAFTWLLFGKDSTGRKDFSIKTFDSSNNVIHKLDHEVTGLFDIDAEEMTLKRVYREKWVTRRGSNEPELQGHETLFYWNDVPMQAGEFQKKVDEVIMEDTFKMLTSPFYFNTLKWQDRRDILTTIAGNVSDADVAAGNEAFAELLKKMDKKTLEEYKKELAAKKKKLKDELKLIPARVDEVTRNTPEAKDWAQLESQIKQIESDIKAIDEQLLDSSKIFDDFYKQKQERQSQIHKLKSRISDIEFEGRQAFAKQTKDKADAISNAKAEIERIQQRVKSTASEVKTIQARIEVWQTEQQALRDKWATVNAEAFPGFGDESKFTCPTCKQELPAETIDAKKAELKANFNRDKERHLCEISEAGRSYGKRIENAQTEIGQLQSKNYDSQIEAQEATIKEWESKRLETVQSILEGNEELEALKTRLNELESTPEQEAPVVDNSELKSRKSDMIAQLDTCKRDLNTRTQIEAANKRKAQLLDEEKAFSQQLADLEQAEFTIQEFTRTKVDMLEYRINGMFKGVKFRMFDEQLNGGMIECCDTLINTNGAWVPWLDGNTAGRINAGIEIINVLAGHHGLIAPIWIDGAEAITNIIDSEAQKIELYVSETHKSLEVA